MCIETKEDWWKAVEKHKVELRGIIERFHPVEREGKTGFVGEITARSAEAVCKQVREEIFREEVFQAGPLQRFDIAFEKKDWQDLRHLFSAAWFGVPESTGVWSSVPAFSVLCDLCSEDWVFEEEEAC